MQGAALIDRLEGNAGVIGHLIEDVPTEQAAWRPAPDKWSILEVMVHLLDEEREDFRTRLDLLWHQPETPFPPIDPRGWVTSRAYADRDLHETLDRFREERIRSVTWLRSLGTTPWDAVRVHPQFGPLSAGDLMGAWVAHDFLHIRQLAHLHFLTVARLAEPHSVGYAGEW